MTDMLDLALQYACRGWHIIPLIAKGKRPAIATGHWHMDAATVDEAQLRKWFDSRSQFNLGIVTGAISDLLVVDLDGPEAFEFWKQQKAGPTLAVKTSKGFHLYYQHPGVEVPISTGGEHEKGVDIRCDGGLVVAPPSIHQSGAIYAWANSLMPAPFPDRLVAWAQARGETKLGGQGAPAATGVAASLQAALFDVPPFEDLADCVQHLPNPTKGWEFYNKMLMAIWRLSEGSEEGKQLALTWSRKNAKHEDKEIDERWAHYFKSPPRRVAFGTLIFHVRREHSTWQPPSRRPREAIPPQFQSTVQPLAQAFAALSAEQNTPQSQPPSPDLGGKTDNVSDVSKTNGNHAPFLQTLPGGSPDNPLIELNNQFCTIGDLGGKCLVLSWIPSKIDPLVKVPSFQTFKSFCDRYSHRYVAVKSKKPDGSTVESHKPLGAYWLQWPLRKSYERLDLQPGKPPELPGPVLNLWRGFGVEPRAGAWPLMKAHITNVLADGDAQAAVYIFRFAAWCVQNPGERAEVAMVFRGGKGSGKGTFANAIRRLFGAHGLQVYSAKHLTGQFNGHLRSCLMLFADEAFWAGDKQGESTLKGMITERTLVVEHKGVDAEAWRNRLKVIMAANAEWVVPASHDERRYAVFNVNGSRIGDEAYFDALQNELNGGGLEAMLHDLLAVKLDNWHPRQIVKTIALQEQKAQSLSPIAEWWEHTLQEAQIGFNTAGEVMSSTLLRHALEFSKRHGDINPTNLARFLKQMGGTRVRRSGGTFWQVEALAKCRSRWEDRYGQWKWERASDTWA